MYQKQEFKTSLYDVKTLHFIYVPYSKFYFANGFFIASWEGWVFLQLWKCCRFFWFIYDFLLLFYQTVSFHSWTTKSRFVTVKCQLLTPSWYNFVRVLGGVMAGEAHIRRAYERHTQTVWKRAYKNQVKDSDDRYIKRKNLEKMVAYIRMGF